MKKKENNLLAVAIAPAPKNYGDQHTDNQYSNSDKKNEGKHSQLFY
jgi:hypothetical protein